MISGANYKSVEIYIKTYNYNIAKTMNEENSFHNRHCRTTQNRYICSICLNQKPTRENKITECSKRKSKSCPICQKSNDSESDCVNQNDSKDNENSKNVKEHGQKERYIKNVQTSQPDVTQGMSLLNEVLTAFQSKKQLETRKNQSCKTIIFKDACINTEDSKKDVSKLTISKVFCCSIEENNQQRDNKYVILNRQPEPNRVSQFSLDLMHRKSSSIPQMKLEELKKSLKEKTKSKDAIEEVNRMFATVRKCEINEQLEDPNRPMIRNGPRVLPVVKTNNESDKTAIEKAKPTFNCRCCQTNYKMSSGDSFECCHRTNDRCEDCFYMMCCHYQQRLNSGTICPNCCNGCDHKKNTNI